VNRISEIDFSIVNFIIVFFSRGGAATQRLSFHAETRRRSVLCFITRRRGERSVLCFFHARLNVVSRAGKDAETQRFIFFTRPRKLSW